METADGMSELRLHVDGKLAADGRRWLLSRPLPVNGHPYQIPSCLTIRVLKSSGAVDIFNNRRKLSPVAFVSHAVEIKGKPVS